MPKIDIITYTDYLGPYNVDPSESVQTLETKNKTGTDDISISEIPSKYGAVERQGDTLIIT